MLVLAGNVIKKTLEGKELMYKKVPQNHHNIHDVALFTKSLQIYCEYSIYSPALKFTV